MTDKAELARHLPWDSRFFGVPIGQIIPQQISPDQVRDVDRWAKTNNIRCVYFLAENTGDCKSIARASGFRLVDTRITLCLDLSGVHGAGGVHLTDYSFRQSRAEDLPKLEVIAGYSHQDSRFYSDGGFERNKCNELYRVWIREAVQDTRACVLVPELSANSSEPLGYIALKVDYLSEQERSGRISLIGVDRDHRRKGLGMGLVSAGVQWFISRSISSIVVVTQERNEAALRMYQSVGFQVALRQLWFHKWY